MGKTDCKGEVMTPYFSDFASFLAMDGHGFYVWLCYGITFLAVLFGIFYARYERKRTLQKIAMHHARKHARTMQGSSHE